jgi:hypothetical protein
MPQRFRTAATHGRVRRRHLNAPLFYCHFTERPRLARLHCAAKHPLRRSDLDALLQWMLGSWHVLGIDIQIWMLAFAGIFLVYGAAHLYLEGRRQLQARRQRQ